MAAIASQITSLTIVYSRTILNTDEFHSNILFAETNDNK